MTKHGRKIKTGKWLPFIITATIITTMIVMCFSLSKYEAAVAGREEATVALMANSTKTDVTNIIGAPRRCSCICPSYYELQGGEGV